MPRVKHPPITETHPKISLEWAEELNDRSASRVTKGSSYRAAWRCSKGHVWHLVVADRLRNNRVSTCPQCSRRREGLDSHLLSEWAHDLNFKGPSEVTGGSEYRATWRCQEGHVWEAAVYSRKKSGCPTCGGKMPGPITETHPLLLSMWDYSKNTECSTEKLTAGSTLKVWWVCSSGHSWKAKVCSLSSGKGCPVCSGHTGELLKDTHPSLLKEWDYAENAGIDVTQVTKGLRTRVGWKCSFGHKWKTSISNRAARKNPSRCPMCFSTRGSKVELDLMNLLGIASATLPIPWGKSQFAKVDGVYTNSKVVVEYDGYYWHKDKFARDISKTKALLGAGYRVIRIRESPLKFLPQLEGLSQLSYDFNSSKLTDLALRLDKLQTVS